MVTVRSWNSCLKKVEYGQINITIKLCCGKVV